MKETAIVFITFSAKKVVVAAQVMEGGQANALSAAAPHTVLGLLALLLVLYSLHPPLHHTTPHHTARSKP